jgi:O-antigen ligase
MERGLPLDWWRRDATAVAFTPDALTAAEPIDGRLAFGALVAFTVVLVLAPQEFVPALGQFRIAFVFGVVALAAHLFRGSKSAGASGTPRESKLVLCLVASAVLSIPTSYWPGGSVATLTDQYLKSIAIFWLLGGVVCSVRRMRSVLWTLTAISVPLALVGVKNYLSGAFVGDRVIGYAGGLTSNPNDLALTLNLFIPLTAALALTARLAWLRTCAWGIIGLSTAAVMVTFSRAGFLTLVVEGGFLLMVLIRRSAVRAAGGLVLCVLLALVALPSGYGQRLSTIVDIDSDPTGSAQDRWRDTVSATQFIVAHPIIGAGVGMDTLALNEVRGPRWVRVHNAYLDYGVDLGVPGLVLFVAVVVTSFRNARRIERMSRDVIGAELVAFASGVRISLAGFIVAAFFYPVPYHFYFYYMAGLSVALKTIAARQSRVL